MDYKILAPSRVAGSVCLPLSKSISNRALIISALSGREIDSCDVAKCDDTDAMLNALSDKGAKEVNIGAAGTAMRFLTAYYSVQQGREVVLDGSERMRHRPIKVLVDALRECGADIEYVGEVGFPPLRIKGARLQANKIKIPGNISSQYISAILMISPLIEGLTQVSLTGEVISRPYIDMTLSLMRKSGVETHWNGNDIVFEKNTEVLDRVSISKENHKILMNAMSSVVSSSSVLSSLILTVIFSPISDGKSPSSPEA